MTRYIAVDSGKLNTKVVALNPAYLEDNKANPYIISLFRTAYEDDATFEDEEPGSETYITEYEGKTYKIGKAARKDAELESSKKGIAHKLCTMLAIARECSEKEIDDVCVAIGIPVDNYLVVKERNEYRDTILPLGQHTVKYRDLNGKIKEKTFNIVKRQVYPETIGAIFTPGVDFTESVGVIDIGHLNVNMTIFNKGEIDPMSRRTTTKGANFLVSGLAQELSNELQTTIQPNKAAEAIAKDRRLKFRNPNPEKEERSAQIIERFITDYVKDIIEEIRIKGWSLDVMQLVVIGGGAIMIKNDLMQVFGENTVIPENSNIINAMGFLKLMCGRSDTLKVMLP